MTYSVTATFAKESAKIEGSYPIDMYVVNASLSGWEPLYFVNLNQDVYGYSLNATGNPTNNATVYTGLPIERGDLSTNTSGEIGELSITIPNTDRIIESVIQSRKYLRGSDIHIISGYAKHLPSGITAKHIGTEPDRHAVLKETMYIDNVTSNEQIVTFNCKSKFNIRNVVLPRRSYYKECTWALIGRYNATECSPNKTINTTTYPTCDGTLENCRTRGNSARFGGFPSVPSRGITII